jgi:hypothetical protein
MARQGEVDKGTGDLEMESHMKAPGFAGAGGLLLAPALTESWRKVPITG